MNKLFLTGIKDGLSIFVGYLVCGASFGILAQSKGVSLTNVLLYSAGGFAGSAQFVALSLFELSTPLTLFITILLIQSRYFLFSLHLGTELKNLSLKERMITGFFLTDELYAIYRRNLKEITFTQMAGSFLLLYFGWVGGSVIGNLIPLPLTSRLIASVDYMLYLILFFIIFPEFKKRVAKIQINLWVTIILSLIAFKLNVPTSIRITVIPILVTALVLSMRRRCAL